MVRVIPNWQQKMEVIAQYYVFTIYWKFRDVDDHVLLALDPIYNI